MLLSRAHEETNPRAILEGDHRVLNELLDRVLASARADDLAEARAAWDNLEVVLLTHLDAEEKYVLPLLESEHPKELAALREAHDVFRRRLSEIGMSFDLHIARCDILEKLASEIRTHAASEEALCYPLADKKLPPSAARELHETLRHDGKSSKRHAARRKPSKARRTRGRRGRR